MSKGRRMTERVPVAPETHERLKEFAVGLKTTFDGAINYALDKLIDAEKPVEAGKRLREDFHSTKDNPKATSD